MTGVQTCALPISGVPGPLDSSAPPLGRAWFSLMAIVGYLFWYVVEERLNGNPDAWNELIQVGGAPTTAGGDIEIA